MDSKHQLTLLSIAWFTGLSYLMNLVPCLAQSEYLRGKVEQQNTIQPSRFTPPIYSSESDPFSSGSSGSYHKAKKPSIAAPKNNPDQFAAAPAQADLIDQQTAQTDKDIDKDPKLQIAWDVWHKRLAKALFARFNTLSKTAFAYSPPLACQVSYTVTHDAQIKNIVLVHGSSNISFNALVIAVLKSLSGDQELLRFPLGSRSQIVQKAGTFTQNYGVEGFNYSTGDKE